MPEHLKRAIQQMQERMAGQSESGYRVEVSDLSRLPANARAGIVRMQEHIAQWQGRIAEIKRQNDERRKERLEKKAAITDYRKDETVFSPPTKKGIAFIRKLEKKGMLLPLSLRAWVEEVGDVNLSGTHPALSFWEDANFPGIFADPLMVTLDHFDFLIEGWLEECEGGEPESLSPVISWDAQAKARLAIQDDLLDYGYSIALPNPAADALLEGEPNKTTFVDYLRTAFRWGGFPGWENQAKRPEKELKLLSEGLLPI